MPMVIPGNSSLLKPRDMLRVITKSGIGGGYCVVVNEPSNCRFLLVIGTAEEAHETITKAHVAGHEYEVMIYLDNDGEYVKAQIVNSLALHDLWETFQEKEQQKGSA